MIIGVLTVDLLIPESNSLKDKRQVVKSLVEGARNRFNISVAEIDDLNKWRSAVIGAACVSNDKKVANTLLNRVLAFVESDPRSEVSGCRIEFL